MRQSVTHDTDPAPHTDPGNGGDRYPCAIHAAQLIETREVLVEVRDLAARISLRVDDECDARAKRDAQIEEAIILLQADVRALVDTVGTGPDVSTGKPGTGMRGQIAAAINAATRAGVRRDMPSLADDEESEVTGVMDRQTLVLSKRAAERALQVARIKTWGAVAVAIIGAMAAAAAMLIPLLKGG